MADLTEFRDMLERMEKWYEEIRNESEENAVEIALKFDTTTE